MRSADDKMIVNNIAKEYGGGGHPHAAGFKTKDLNKFIKFIKKHDCSSHYDTLPILDEV